MTTNKVTGVHPVSQLFPPLPDDEFAGLVKSIRLTGQQSPITCDPNGLLLDGINRLKACEAVGVEPRIAIHHGDPIEFILAANIVRRHLSMGQRMMIIALAFPAPEKGGRGKKSLNYSKLEGFSVSRLSEARTVLAYSPELADQVRLGSCPLQRALVEATTPRMTGPIATPHRPARMVSLAITPTRTTPDPETITPTRTTSDSSREAHQSFLRNRRTKARGQRMAVRLASRNAGRPRLCR